MERNVNYATIVSTGEKPEVELHVVGFDEGSTMNFHTNIQGSNRDIILAMSDTVKAVGGKFRDMGLGKFYLVNVLTGMVEGVGVEAFLTALNEMRGGTE